MDEFADNTTEVDNTYTEGRLRQTKIVDHCPHSTHNLESQLQLKGDPIEQSVAVKDVSRSLILQIVLTLVFCVTEFVTGLIGSSIALLADSYHMAADVMALIVAVTCIKIATRPSTRHGYGWVRSETLGGFFNGIFMLTVCASIFQEALGRCINIHVITHPWQVLIVGGIGLGINLIGMCCLRHGHTHGDHGHSHGGDEEESHVVSRKDREKNSEKGHGHSHANGGHGHSHANGGHGHSHGHSEKEEAPKKKNRGACESAKPEVCTRLLNEEDDGVVERRLSGATNQNAILATVDRQMTPYGTHVASNVLNSSSISLGATKTKKGHEKARNENIDGVWLHLFSDALGSVIVMISAGCLIIWPQYAITAYLDPLLSLCLATIMGFTASVLVKNSGRKLLKRTPKGLNPDEVKEDLCSIVGVSKVEKLSVWTLCGQRIIASVHVNVCHPAVFPEAAFKIKKYFHDMGVHSTTIEPTFEDACMQSMRVQATKKGGCGMDPLSHTTENEISVESTD